MKNSFLRSLLGIFLMGLGFPKMFITERKWPRPVKEHVQQPEETWTHNVKDDFTDDMLADKEYWIKLLGFVIIVLMIIVIILLFWG